MIQFAKQIFDLGRDFLFPPEAEQLLHGNKLFRPLMGYQRQWIQHFYPGGSINTAISPWRYLQKYMMPLIQRHASSYHLKGIDVLELDKQTMPDFEHFRQKFYEVSNGFNIEPVSYEITPVEYFTLISQKKFPCIKELRSHSELFCANEPDFWHEAIGHIAPLCFSAVQNFYLETAERFLSDQSPASIHSNKAVTWTMMEYVFLKEQDELKMFGAALVGSHLANMRYLHNHIHINPLNRSEIIKANKDATQSLIARDQQGKLQLYSLDSLNAAALFAA